MDDFQERETHGLLAVSDVFGRFYRWQREDLKKRKKRLPVLCV